MDSINQARKLTLRQLTEVAVAAGLATVIMYATIVATSPASAQLFSFSV